MSRYVQLGATRGHGTISESGAVTVGHGGLWEKDMGADRTAHIICQNPEAIQLDTARVSVCYGSTGLYVYRSHFFLR